MYVSRVIIARDCDAILWMTLLFCRIFPGEWGDVMQRPFRTRGSCGVNLLDNRNKAGVD